jgi:hypothetical protein
VAVPTDENDRPIADDEDPGDPSSGFDDPELEEEEDEDEEEDDDAA